MTDAVKTTREPKSSKFTQQQLRAFRPVLLPYQVIIAYLTLSVIAIPLGTVCLHAAGTVKEIKFRYDHLNCSGFDNYSRQHRSEVLQTGSAVTCRMMVPITEQMKAPVYLYYELEDYYQNHRRYVKSRSEYQLAGKSGGDKTACKPKLFQRNEQTLEFDESLPINPCGLTAWSFFNDSIQVERQDNADPINLNEKGIAWESDVKYIFGDHAVENFNNKPGLRGGATIEGNVSDNEHFIVWMRIAALPTFRKLYGILEEDLDADDRLTITIENRYNTYLFGGQKSIVLSTTAWLGGKNEFIGIVFIVAGVISFVVGCMYFAFHLRFPRDVADIRFVSWKRKVY